MKLKHIIILQNKIDLVTQPQAKEQHQQIIKFVQGNFVTFEDSAPQPVCRETILGVPRNNYHISSFFRMIIISP